MDLRLGENLSGIKKDYVAPFFGFIMRAEILFLKSWTLCSAAA